MARVSLVSSILLLLCCAAAAATFDDSNPIRLASDGLRDFEAQVIQIIGHTHHALSFARFAHRWVPALSRSPTIKFTCLSKSSWFFAL
jgi:cathepsin H